MAALLRRTFSTTAFRRAVESAAASAGEHGSSKPWKYASFFIALPAIVLVGFNAYVTEVQHVAHHHRPDFIEYTHLRTRTKAFPWGDGTHSFFHNPQANALPSGYEEEAHHH